MKHLEKATRELLHVTLDQMRTTSKDRHLADARRIFVFIAIRKIVITQKDLAKHLNRSPSWVTHTFDSAASLRTVNTNFRALLNQVEDYYLTLKKHR